MSDSPKLFLAMDNCFAIKRWITPAQWFPVIKEMGATSIEASTDNEVDPLFLPASYMDDWVAEVKALEKEHGIRVRSFFTGYQTYRTAGLAHPDQRVRTKLVEDWYKPLICKAGQLDADIGFSFHAVCEEELGSPERYWEAIRRSNECFAHLAAFACEHNRVKLCCEQMYAPYQPAVYDRIRPPDAQGRIRDGRQALLHRKRRRAHGGPKALPHAGRRGDRGGGGAGSEPRPHEGHLARTRLHV